MGNKKSKAISKSSIKPTQEKLYMNDPVFGKMVYSQTGGAWVPAENGDLYEQAFKNYANEKEKNKKYLKTCNIKSERIKNFYEETHKSFTIIKTNQINLGIYSYIYFLNDGRLALNYDKTLNIYSKDLETIEQKIYGNSIFITQLKDNSLINSKYNGADIYKYDKEQNKFILDYTLKCINNAGKVMELTNERLAFLSNDTNISIYSKENGKYEKEGKSLVITTIDDFVPINDNEIASISGQESEITFWDLTTREKNAQIGEIKNYGHSCMLLFGNSLIVGGADRYNTIIIFMLLELIIKN